MTLLLKQINFVDIWARIAQAVVSKLTVPSLKRETLEAASLSFNLLSELAVRGYLSTGTFSYTEAPRLLRTCSQFCLYFLELCESILHLWCFGGTEPVRLMYAAELLVHAIKGLEAEFGNIILFR